MGPVRGPNYAAGPFGLDRSAGGETMLGSMTSWLGRDTDAAPSSAPEKTAAILPDVSAPILLEAPVAAAPLPVASESFSKPVGEPPKKITGFASGTCTSAVGKFCKLGAD